MACLALVHDLPLNVNYGPNGGADLTHVPPVSVEGLFFFFCLFSLNLGILEQASGAGCCG